MTVRGSGNEGVGGRAALESALPGTQEAQVWVVTLPCGENALGWATSRCLEGDPSFSRAFGLLGLHACPHHILADENKSLEKSRVSFSSPVQN